MFSLKCQTCRYVALINSDKPVCTKYVLFTNDARTDHFCGKEARDWQPSKSPEEVNLIDKNKIVKLKLPPNLWWYQ